MLARANENAVDGRHRSPAWVAACYRHVGALQKLLSANADVDQVDFQGTIPAVAAAICGSEDVVRLLASARGPGCGVNGIIFEDAFSPGIEHPAQYSSERRSGGR